MSWTPTPGMKIRHMTNPARATVLKLNHPAMPDGTGPLWEMREDGASADCFIYEANMTAYWEPILETKGR